MRFAVYLCYAMLWCHLIRRQRPRRRRFTYKSLANSSPIDKHNYYPVQILQCRSSIVTTRYDVTVASVDHV
ncbi:unnamed protein product [Nippostrongylus brasiliensis]|uniref:Secreted protein n=1 Tax=Nippostrongylus brasiliensis TaxID=27835 RepID=A0A0N4Y708_NIPBR|nr:unnamed protein product [Nippostrongylus brasiliensis]